MAQKINQKQFVNIVKEAITKTLKESGFNGYDMQPQTPMTKQQQIDASWQEFNDNNKKRLAQQQQDAKVSSYLDSNINTDDLKGQLGMDAMSNDKDVANIAQMTKGTPRQTGQRYDNYLKQKYMESKKQRFNMTENQLNSLIKECITEVLAESTNKQLKESDEFKPTGYRTASNLGGHEVQIHPSGDSARFKFYGGEPTDWMEIEFDENGAAYVETERGRELLADYMRYQ
jgi:hypothetical protein